MSPVAVSMNPALVRFGVQLYAVSGGTWIPVPDGTTRDDLPRYMTWEPARAAVSRPGSSQPPGVLGASGRQQTRLWKVQGNGGEYTVREQGGVWSCECKGFSFRRNCRHVKEKRAKYESR